MATDTMRGEASFRAYLGVVVGIVLTTLALLTAVAAYIEPLHGELTRLGGYAERDFGWNGVQRLPAKDAVMHDRYDRYFDVVVVGDSFSKPGIWQSVLRSQTGLSFTTLDVVNTSLARFETVEPILTAPPKLVVVEIGERLLMAKFGADAPQCAPASGSPERLRLVTATAVAPVRFRETVRARTLDVHNVNLRYALLFAQRSAVRSVLGRDFTLVERYALSRGDLFTNAKADQILVYKDDRIKTGWTADQVRRAGCAIKDVQQRIEANGVTRFVLLLIPDKSSAYADHIVDPRFRSLPPFHAILAEEGVNLPRIDKMLKRAIDAGEPDVYLPNDTHFGFRGYELAGLGVVDFLTRR